jgi:hypothetical protein
MKNVFKILGVIALVAVIGFGVAACKSDDDDDDGDGGGGGLVPKELKGNWLRDTEGSERYLTFTDSKWWTNTDGFVTTGKTGWDVKSASGNKIEYQDNFGSGLKNFTWSVSGSTLTILTSSDDRYLSADATYTKQP